MKPSDRIRIGQVEELAKTLSSISREDVEFAIAACVENEQPWDHLKPLMAAVNSGRLMRGHTY
jgi:hypothetical protein